MSNYTKELDQQGLTIGVDSFQNNKLIFWDKQGNKALQIDFDKKEIKSYGGWFPDACLFLEVCGHILKSRDWK